MTAKELLNKVLKMRTLQKEYFRTRSLGTLSECRTLEKEVDRDLKAFFADDGQTSLFT